MKNFRIFLKKKGKKENVINDLINRINKFSNYLRNDRKKDLLSVNIKDIDAYIDLLKSNKEKK